MHRLPDCTYCNPSVVHKLAKLATPPGRVAGELSNLGHGGVLPQAQLVLAAAGKGVQTSIRIREASSMDVACNILALGQHGKGSKWVGANWATAAPFQRARCRPRVRAPEAVGRQDLPLVAVPLERADLAASVN
jgi:hypothetical protein